jgi:hypothetical protein
VPPRYAYWTIIAGGLPTAFRAADREELLPTFQRIKEKHPDAEMKWFARGRLWESQEEARHSGTERQKSRDRNWRPGGEHRDPRQKFVDAKKQRNGRIRAERWQRKNTTPRKPWVRGQETEEPREPPRPRGPNREPRPDENPEPTPPPQPDVPVTPPLGPPERGRRPQRRFQPRGRLRKGPRR